MYILINRQQNSLAVYTRLNIYYLKYKPIKTKSSKRISKDRIMSKFPV